MCIRSQFKRLITAGQHLLSIGYMAWNKLYIETKIGSFNYYKK